MADNKPTDLLSSFRRYSTTLAAPTPSASLTEEAIARGVAKGLADAAATTTESERDLWLRLYSGAAPLVTRVGIVPAGGVTRIAFGEQYDESSPTQFRAAVTMSDYNVYEFWKLLGNSPAVQYWRDQEEKAAKEAAPEANDGDN